MEGKGLDDTLHIPRMIWICTSCTCSKAFDVVHLFWIHGIWQHWSLSSLIMWLSWMYVRLVIRRLWVRQSSATFFLGDWSWNVFCGLSFPSADSRRAVVSFCRKNVHNIGYPLREPALPRQWLGNWPCSTGPKWVDWPQHKQNQVW